MFGDAHRAIDHIGFEPTTEAAAEQMIVHRHRVEGNAGRFRRRFLHARLAARRSAQICSEPTSAFGPSSQLITSASRPFLAAHI